MPSEYFYSKKARVLKRKSPHKRMSSKARIQNPTMLIVFKNLTGSRYNYRLINQNGRCHGLSMTAGAKQSDDGK